MLPLGLSPFWDVPEPPSWSWSADAAAVDQPFIEIRVGPLGGAPPGHLYVVPARPTWRALKVSKAGRSWVVSVTDPAGGSVTLRSTVIDVNGDSTVQTIFRAYGIR